MVVLCGGGLVRGSVSDASKFEMSKHLITRRGEGVSVWSQCIGYWMDIRVF